MGEIGTQKLGVVRNARICDVFVDGDWWFRRCRDRIFQELVHDTKDFPLQLVENVSDEALWWSGEGSFDVKFISSTTWDLIRKQGDSVDWSRLVWFPQGVPRFAFIPWLAIRDRLPTGHHTSQWGQPQGCLFCGEPDETRDHLYFACPYTFTLWIRVVGNLFGRDLDRDWETTMLWLLTGSYDSLTYILLRLVLQVSIYYIWRERNERKHNGLAKPVDHLAPLIDKTVRSRITSTGYSRKPKLQGLMRRWFEVHTT
ncbi:hypothetical protein DY000_02033669 [Brassica cretica]|uniref:Reverse transcriptase zinc-binding domain-containing protein n=1 Tax=Brassica cretica TaxID=69181 RepID=A0ABQ7DW42_BRACR|nr:hypothetical protein DY000_02033669 [Brassica cretica]